MLLLLQIRILRYGSFSRFNSFHHSLNSLRAKKTYLSMVTESGHHTKRPTCPDCSKPIRICLCARLKTPILQNSIAVTILQHNLEKKHPLNSTRIATIGLKDVTVSSVSDVNFRARFFIHFLESEHDLVPETHSEDETGDFGKSGSSKRKWDFVEMPLSLTHSSFGKTSNFGEISTCIDLARESGGGLYTIIPSSLTNGEFTECLMDSLEVKGGILGNDEVRIQSGVKEFTTGKRRTYELEEGSSEKARNGAVSVRSEGVIITCTIEKYGAIKSFFDQWTIPNKCQKRNNFDHLLDSKKAAELLAKGFVVKKSQTKQLNGTVDLELVEEFEEFDIKVPPGSILLFPSEKSVGIEAIEFEVKNLIVLDGTWAKAKRMYNENPWLKLLPHVKLDIDKLSLYNEVRHQPRAGYLSTIESIVYALKAFGENSDKLDDLLHLFESMVEDQRRCRDERLISTKSN